MSIRALGNQFKAHVVNRGKGWVPGTAEHPQGQLFKGYRRDRPKPSAATMEANRRLMKGEKVPRGSFDAPTYHRWDPHAGRFHGPKQKELFK